MSRKRKVQVGSSKTPNEEQLLDGFIQDRRATAGPPRTVRVSDLVGNPDNPREEMGDLEELAASLKAHGLRQPVGVVSASAFVQAHPHHKDAVDGAAWVVINGNRRLAAARLAGLDTLAVYQGEGEADSVSVRTAALVENIHRKDLEPLEEAREISKLVELGISRSEVARLLEKTPGWVTQRLILLELHPDLQQALRSGELKLGKARELGKLPREEQLAAYEEDRTAFYSVKSGGGEPAPPAPSVPGSTTFYRVKSGEAGSATQPADEPGAAAGEGETVPLASARRGAPDQANEGSRGEGALQRPASAPPPASGSEASGRLGPGLAWGGPPERLAAQIYEGLAERLPLEELDAVLASLAARR